MRSKVRVLLDPPLEISQVGANARNMNEISNDDLLQTHNSIRKRRGILKIATKSWPEMVNKERCNKKLLRVYGGYLGS